MPEAHYLAALSSRLLAYNCRLELGSKCIARPNILRTTQNNSWLQNANET